MDTFAFDFIPALEMIGKLTLAALLGAAVGFERESHGQSAGLRTNLMICVGSCLMMMLSLHMEELFWRLDANSIVRIDPGRIASYAISGMGFLGAGAIIKGRGTVRGLTTAAGLWLNTGIGLAIGAGYLLPAIYTTFISLFILYNLRFLKVFVAHDVYTVLTISCISSEKPLTRIRKILGEHPGIDIRFINYSSHLSTDSVTYRIRLRSKEHHPWGKIIGRLTADIPGLKEIAWEESDVP
ncbi:MgtC/SapB family protein [Syntrophobacter fumaroxidans]|uniref:MgtC/SapB transporter n=1 Tax=Syntrophobacter fumaroxidans (strain DSM 10017 / MPOB) TaxID=335543 RepID=A0LMS6_SYNFM|nr:MgtC/SapB family protein [Syntrophobacter fumaroxidans]ABK18728.1 MgtC/SapB transporter [Syntrophobacter fumaroxidans MPOB]